MCTKFSTKSRDEGSNRKKEKSGDEHRIHIEFKICSRNVEELKRVYEFHSKIKI